MGRPEPAGPVLRVGRQLFEDNVCGCVKVMDTCAPDGGAFEEAEVFGPQLVRHGASAFRLGDGSAAPPCVPVGRNEVGSRMARRGRDDRERLPHSAGEPRSRRRAPRMRRSSGAGPSACWATGICVRRRGRHGSSKRRSRPTGHRSTGTAAAPGAASEVIATDRPLPRPTCAPTSVPAGVGTRESSFAWRRSTALWRRARPLRPRVGPRAYEVSVRRPCGARRRTASRGPRLIRRAGGC